MLIMFLSQHKKLSAVSCWRSIMIICQMITENKIRFWILYKEALSDLKLLKISVNMLQSAQFVKKKQFINISLMINWNCCSFHQMWLCSKKSVWIESLNYLFLSKIIKSLIAYLQLYVVWQSTYCLFLSVKLLSWLSLQNCFLSTLSAVLGSSEMLSQIETLV